MAAERTGRLPDFIIIGAQKCGTTSLDYYLWQHPAIAMAPGKELDFFVNDERWQRGVEWYRSCFDTRAARVGESSPNYTTYPNHDAVARMQDVLRPETKFVYIVRDPIERILSQYVHFRAKDWVSGSLAETLFNPTEGRDFIDRSRYHLQLARYLEVYPREQFHLVVFEDLLHRRRETLAALFAFLGVDPTFHSFRFGRRLLTGKSRRQLTPLGRRLRDAGAGRLAAFVPGRFRTDVKWYAAYPFSRRVPRPLLDVPTLAFLKETLAEDADAFRRLTGLKFEHWSV